MKSMIRLLLITCAFFCLSLSSAYALGSAEVIIHQETINDFFNAIGPISGKGTYKGFMSVDYTWVVKNARIEIQKDKALFIADASVEAGMFKQGSVVKGGIDLKYNQKISSKLCFGVNYMNGKRARSAYIQAT